MLYTFPYFGWFISKEACAFFGRFMNQYTGFGNTTRPVTAQVDVRFLGRNQQELRIGLGLQRAEVRVELVETQVGEIGGMPVAVEVHDHRRVDAHRLQHRLEWRRPLEAVGHRLHGVGEVPVRAQRFVAGKRRESIAIGVAQHMGERRFGSAVRERKNTLIRCARPGGALAHG